jgi:2'-hydroxyisoflavone reductase
MDILILGGTRFVGRALTELGLARGHTITLFHRGQSNPDIFPEVERILGDRNTDIANLGERQWDAVIDTCGYIPRHVRDAAEYLKDKVKRYVFISTISVYTENTEIGRDEDTELATLADETTEAVTGQTYGGLKVLCEQAAEAVMPGRVIQIRPGLIVGPHDPTNRFTYWPVRVRKGGNVLVPGDGSCPAQFIDVRDLADFTIKCLEDDNISTFNATGPDSPLTLQQVLDMTQAVTGSDAHFSYVDEQWLQEKEVGTWMELPLWLPGEEGQALMQISIQRGLNKGLKFRPLEETIRDTLTWYDEIKGDEKTWQAGMNPEKESALLGEYQAKAN